MAASDFSVYLTNIAEEIKIRKKKWMKMRRT
jgi:hypothetical protein